MRARWLDSVRHAIQAKNGKWMSLLIASWCFTLAAWTPAGAQDTLRTVLVLHSYNVDYPWTNFINDGILETLQASNIPLDIRTEYMDTKFEASDGYLNLLVEEYKFKYHDYPIDAIVVSDDNGLRFLLKHRDEIFPGVPITFCGVNSYQGELYLQDELLANVQGVTGVVEQIDIEANLQLIMRLHPDTQRILMFADQSVTSQRNVDNAKQAVAKLNLPVQVVLRDNLTIAQVLAEASSWGPGDVRLEIGTLQNERGAVLSHTESCDMICAASHIPTYGCWTYLLGHGVIGGKVVDGQTQGRTAASMAVQILQGHAVDTIPIQYSSPNLYIFEYPELQHYKVDARRLPPDSIIENKPQTVFQQYPIQSSVTLILGVALLVLVVILVIINRIRKRAENALIISEERLRLAVQNVPVMLWAYDEKGTTIVWNRECERITGFSAADIVGNPGAFELVYPDPTVRERLLDMRRKHPGDIQGWEHPVTCKDSTVRTISMTNISAQYPVPGWASWGVGVDVTARKRVERQLRESREHFYRLVTLAQEGIVSGDEYEHITFANPAFSIALGYEPGELIGKSLLDLCDEQSRQRVFSGTEQRRRSVVSVYEVSLRTRNGELRDFLLSASPLLDSKGNYEGSLGVFTDITELKLTQEALRRSEESYRQLVEALPDGVLVILAGQITYANTAAVEVFKAGKAASLLGESFEAKVLAGELQRWRQFCELMDFDIALRPTLEITLQRTGGTPVDVEIHAARIQVDNQPGIQLILRETHERKLLLQKVLNQQKDESITTLAGGLAHDFNNILLGITGAVNLLSQSGNLPPEDIELCDLISNSAGRMADLTKKLLSYARSTKAEPQAVQAWPLIESALQMARGTLPKSVKVRVELPDDLWPLYIDPVQFEQVLINLIINAGESMATSGGELVITGANITHPARWLCSLHTQHVAGNFVQINVHDTGAGMDEETRRRVFDPFFSTKFQGRGLGLSVAHGIIRAHEGCLTVTSQPGAGSEFRLLVPRAETAARQQAPRTTKPSGGTEAVLIIDDEEHVLRLANRILSGYGYQVLGGLGVEQGLAVFHEHAGQINLVIIDRGLPEPELRGLLARLRQARTGLAVVISSGHPVAEALAGLEEYAPLGFLQKPYRATDLAQVVRDMLDHPAAPGV
jgi:two-component system, cell cycle sensor histidine kinase and response regulator CckA